MNKTLLLIMCDFMLLNLLALTRWEKAEPSHTQLESAAPRSAVNAPAINADMVELMRLTLEDEKSARDALATQLASTRGSLSEREKNLAALQQQKGQLENSLAANQSSTRELEQRFTATVQEAALSKEQLAKMQAIYIGHRKDKVDIVEELTAKIEELESSLNEQIKESVELTSELNEHKKFEAIYAA
ncbi:MAG: hypothetical protein EBT98_10255, partial [Opitutaceae bacterium]|nr:hypothetical protein [Opitutaceae bacterium]